MRARRTAAGALITAILLAVAANGCGPIEAAFVINNAEVAIAGARTARAEEYSPYEYITAELFLEKAREERGYAHFGRAIRYGRKASQSAREAQTRSLQRIREEGSGGGSGITSRDRRDEPSSRTR